jgi:hypothetical protein
VLHLRAAARGCSSKVNTLPKAKSKTRSKQNKDMHKFSWIKMAARGCSRLLVYSSQARVDPAQNRSDG